MKLTFLSIDSHLSDVIVFFLFLYLFSLPLWGLFSAPSWANSLPALSLVALEAIVLVMALRIAHENKRSLLILFAIYILFFFLIRFCVLLLTPDYVANSKLFEGGNIQYTDGDLMRSLGYLIAGTVAFLVGVLIAGESLPNVPRRYASAIVETSDRSPKWAVLVMITTELIRLFFVLTEKPGWLGPSKTMCEKILLQMCDSSAVLMIYLVFVGSRWHRWPIGRRFMYTLPVFFMVGNHLITSSKSAFIGVLLMIFIYLLAKKGDLRIKVFRWIILGVPIGILVLFTFQFGRVLRHAIVVDQISMGLSPKVVIKTIRKRSEKMGEGWINIDIPIRFLQRLDGLDSILPTINEKYHLKDGRPENLFTMDNQIKSVVNFILPGRPFPVPLAGQSYAVQYLGFPVELYTKRGGTTNYPLSLWGVAFVHFGAGGGLIFIFFIGFLISHAYTALVVSPEMDIFKQMMILYTLFWGLNNYGIDDWTINVISVIFSLFLFLFLIDKTNRVICWTKSKYRISIAEG